MGGEREGGKYLPFILCFAMTPFSRRDGTFCETAVFLYTQPCVESSTMVGLFLGDAEFVPRAHIL